MCKKSESIIEIAKALCKFNGEIQKIEKDSTNPHFKNKYASLDNIIDDIRPILTKNGLSIIQMPGGDGENFKMSTLLIHESGEWIESDPIVMKPTKNDPQGIGSCATYARRYSLSAFLSLNTGEDDDGNDASKNQNQHQQNHNKPPLTNQESQQGNSSNPAAEGNASPSGSSTATPNVALVSESQRKMLWAKHKASTLVGFVRINEHLGYIVTKVDHVQAKDVNKLIKLLDDNKMVDIPHDYSKAQ